MDALFSTLWMVIKVVFTVTSTFVGTLTSLPFGIGGILSTILWALVIVVIYRYSPSWLRDLFKTVATKIWGAVSPYVGVLFDKVVDRVRYRAVHAPVEGTAQSVARRPRTLRQHTSLRVRWMIVGGCLVLSIQNWEKIYTLFF